MAKERAEATFRILDTNHDGQLNEDEFVEVHFVIFDLTGHWTVTQCSGRWLSETDNIIIIILLAGLFV